VKLPFGVEIKLSGSNGQYVKHSDCIEKHEPIKDALNQRIEDLKGHIDKRFDDFKDFLKNGK
jgi:hypothetical protein